ncbi:FAD binding domain-containing protein [Blautia sp. MSJ-19]|uniref:FAD binding domain-containing protein n=1 Tax=Blautia sp. MSJ-19 TaxID=2841517 RepID=UPI001C0EA81B|nr:FAD binding domain-containing protein [Blautia sp. MSJ-19]MBU5482323.1 FAD binding domain-containing protein [Blautia sp. MSJ-19]
MLKIKSYVKVKSIAEAYELNQKKTALVLGGMVWLKMGNRNISTAIDLSGLGLDTVQELDDEFVIGCMTPLRELEIHKNLNTYTQGAIRESIRHIVGVQFRNCATVGGSIWGRYGFSDVLTMFLAMDTWVELYDAGRIPLTEFVNRKKDNDILVNIIVKKKPLSVCYMSQRNSKTDFPVLTCAASLIGEEVRTVIGARPGRAMVVEDKQQFLKDFRNMTDEQRTEAIEKFAVYAAENVNTAGNMRASEEYRTLLVKVLTKRAWEAVGGMKDEY